MPVCNCSFSFGGRGIYFGGKDVLLSELSGAFAISAEAGQADKQGVFKSARITMQFGGAQLASAQRYLHMPQPCCVPRNIGNMSNVGQRG